VLLTDRKRRYREIESIVDYLPVWRFVRQRCFQCGHTEDHLAPLDLSEFLRDQCHCGGCGKHVSKVVGVIPDLPGASLREAQRLWSMWTTDGWEPEYFPLVREATSGRGLKGVPKP
jgi:hypothetical protein